MLEPLSQHPRHTADYGFLPPRSAADAKKLARELNADAAARKRARDERPSRASTLQAAATQAGTRAPVRIDPTLIYAKRNRGGAQ